MVRRRSVTYDGDRHLTSSFVPLVTRLVSKMFALLRSRRLSSYQPLRLLMARATSDNDAG